MINSALTGVDAGVAPRPEIPGHSVLVIPPAIGDATNLKWRKICNRTCKEYPIRKNITSKSHKIVFYLDGLVTFVGQFRQCVHLSHRCVVVNGPGVAAGIGAMTNVRRRLAVVQNRSGTYP